MEQALEPHRWTREEYDRLVAAGALDDLPVELLCGVIVEVSPEGPEHQAVVQALIGLLAAAAAERRLRVGAPLWATDDSEPEPDLAITGPPSPAEHPSTADLAIEVVVSRRVAARAKIGVYAAAGVRESWIVDVPGRQVDVLSEPSADGYARHRTLRGDDVLAVEAYGASTTVAELFAGAGLV